MSSEIPFPTPYSVICSPIHMRKIVPAVSVRTHTIAGPNPDCMSVPGMSLTRVGLRYIWL